ncbi:YraN family protein [Clostridium sp. CM028]|uniref:YraN family protein n=1 Tax=unclassified Clostridium TaxID=2614128 RepID=UPI001C0C302F|nr:MULTISPECIES: YraN family protein [unclassified Clostridium]MBU3091634.1 YraN family protein [Clostridium sp. CF011]MBW9144101.1 YraN family protein [Clostridium sp. CM027]MBW9147588.1 YraN family protein [Clostridium sp. CM028]UVE41253.1 YraN family protein [Clostridium sp. CM027]WAG70248.1 YraN family protein [Clostridium sp. CF011]
MKTFNKDIGALGEDISENYLENLGYRILDKNFRCKCGEIDLIAINKGYICFVEVKTRYGIHYGTPAESVTSSKQKKICKTAQVYISRKNIIDYNFRFDVVEVMLNNDNNNFLINHIEDAFQL